MTEDTGNKSSVNPSPPSSVGRWSTTVSREPKSIGSSFRFAWEGIKYVVSTQRHMRAHFFVIALVMLAAWGLGVPRGDFLHLLFATALVLITEIFNTVVETSMDLLVDTYNLQAKVAKDVAAGGVFVAAIYAVIVAAIVFLSSEQLAAVFQTLPALPPRPQVGTIQLVIIGGILVGLIVVAIKQRTRRGTLMRGGVVSGHTAIGFLLATSIIILTGDLAVTALALALAMLLSQSRMQARIHSPVEVVFGAVVGSAVAAVIFLWPIG